MLPRQAKSGGYKYGRVSGDAPFAEAMDSVAASAATPDFSSQGLAIGKKKVVDQRKPAKMVMKVSQTPSQLQRGLLKLIRMALQNQVLEVLPKNVEMEVKARR